MYLIKKTKKNQENIIDRNISNLLKVGVLKKVNFNENKITFTILKNGTEENKIMFNLKEINVY